MEYEEPILLRLMRGDERAFTMLFRKYYTDLVLFAGTFIPDKDVCEDIVQNVFVTLWTKREEIVIKTSLKSYLLKSVANGCLDEIRHRKIVCAHEAVVSIETESLYSIDTENYLLYSELRLLLRDTLDKLPDNCKEVFELSRVKGIKYKDIAQKLNISERTVQERITKTLDILRRYLRDFIPFLFFLHFL